MKKYLFLLGFNLIFVSLFSAAQAEDAADTSTSGKEISIVADEWCPYNCKPDSENPGFMIEIAKQIFEPKGIKINYQVMPWERAIEQTRKGSFNAIVGAGVGDAPDFIYPAEPIGYTSNVFYVKSDSSWKFEDIESLKTVSLGVIDGYTYETKLDEYIVANANNPLKIQAVSGETGLDQNFKKLTKGRIDVYLENMNVAQKYIADNNLWGKFKVAGQIQSDDVKQHYLYIAFSPVNAESAGFAKTLSEGVVELRNSGKLKDILNKYNLRDWAEEAME